MERFHVFIIVTRVHIIISAPYQFLADFYIVSLDVLI